MNAFTAANQARLSLKMMLSSHYWYSGSSVESDGESYIIVVYMAFINDGIRKVIPPVHQGIEVKIDVHGFNRKQRQGY